MNNTQPVKFQAMYSDINNIILKETLLIKDLINIIIDYIDDGPKVKGELYKKVNKIKFRDFEGIATDGMNIYICHSSKSQIQIIDTNVNFITFMDIFDEKNKPFHQLLTIEIYNSELYVVGCDDTQSSSTVMIFNIFNRTLTRKFKCDNYYYCIKIHGSLIYMNFYNLIDIYTTEGEFVRKITTESLLPHIKINFLSSIFVKDNEIYLVDIGGFTGEGAKTTNGCIVCLSMEGNYKFHLDKKIRLLNPGVIYLTNRSLYVFDKKGINQYDRTNNFELIKYWGKQSCRAARGIVFVDNKCYVVNGRKPNLYIYK